MLTVKAIVYSVGNPSDRYPIVVDESGNEYRGPIKKVGYLWKIGGQYFNHEGFEVMIPEYIASIGEHIRPINYSETRDLFFATRTDGKKTLVWTEFFNERGDSMSAFEIEESKLIKYPDVRFGLFRPDLEIVPINLSGTLFEDWITEYQPGRSKSKTSDWLLLKDSFGFRFMHLPSGTFLELCFMFEARQRAFMRRSPENENGFCFGYRTESYFHSPPEFFTDPVLGKCMRIDGFQADEGTISDKFNVNYNSILLYQQ